MLTSRHVVRVTESSWEHLPGRRGLPIIVGLAGLAGLTALQVGVNAPRIERALRRQANAALTGNGLAAAKVSFNGRDARIADLDPTDRARAHDLVRGVVGVRHVEETVRSSRGKVAGAARFVEARVDAGTVVLRGQVPDDSMKRLVVERVTAGFGAAKVRDELVVGGAPVGPADPGRYARLGDLVAIFAGSEHAEVRWEGDAVRLRGAVPTRIDRARVVAAATDIAGGRGTVTDDLTVSATTVAATTVAAVAAERLEFDGPFSDATVTEVLPQRLEFDGPFTDATPAVTPTTTTAPA